MRDETIQFLFDKSTINVEAQLDILTKNYKETLKIYRVIEAQIIEDFNRRITANDQIKENEEKLIKLKSKQNKDLTSKEKKDMEKFKDIIREAKKIRDEKRPLHFQLKKIQKDDIRVALVLKYFWKIRTLANLDNWIRKILGGGASKTGKKYRKFLEWCSKNGLPFDNLGKDLPKQMKRYFYEEVNLDEHRPVD